MLHGDARHTAPRGGPRAAVEPPVVAWSRDVGGPIEAQVIASPDEQTLYVASLGGTLTALARGDGARALDARRSATASTRRPCVADDGTIYVGSDAKKFSAVSPRRARSSGRSRPTATPTRRRDRRADGTVVFAAGRMVYARDPARLRALALRGQAQGLHLARDRPTQGASSSARRTTTRTRSRPTGRLAWSVDLGADVDGAPAIGDDGSVVRRHRRRRGRPARSGRRARRVARAASAATCAGRSRSRATATCSRASTARAARRCASRRRRRRPRRVRRAGDRRARVRRPRRRARGRRAARSLFGAQDDAVVRRRRERATALAFHDGRRRRRSASRCCATGRVVVGSDDGTVTPLRARAR